MHLQPIGRDDQLRLLEGCLGGALQATATGAILDGEAGVGKSTLLRSFVHLAREKGSTVAVGACLPIPGLPYAPIVQVLRELAAPGQAPGRQVEVMAARLILMLSAGADAVAPLRAPPQRSMVFDQLLQLVSAASDSGPMVIGLEDLQWIDVDSAELLLFLLRNVDERGDLVFVGTQRTDAGPSPAAMELLLELRRSPGITRIAVPRLSDEHALAHVARFADAMGIEVDEAHVSQIVRLADGIPFHIEELVLDAGDGKTVVPPSLQHVFRNRFSQLPGETQRLLRAASVAGRRVETAALEAVLGREYGEVDTAIAAALAAGFLRVEMDSDVPGYAFRHALLREAVYADILPPERQRLHRRHAEVLLQSVSGAISAPLCSEIAHHWDGASAHEALAAHVRAGEVALQIHAYASADQHLSRAVDLWRQGEDSSDRTGGTDLLRSAALATYLCGHVRRAAELIEEALGAIDKNVDPVEAGALWARLAEYRIESTGPDSAAEAIVKALALIPEHPPSVQRASVLRLAGSRERLLGRNQESIGFLEKALRMARATSARSVEVAALVDLGVARCVTGNLALGLALLEEGQDIVDEDPSSIEATVRFWPAEAAFGVRVGWTGELERGVDEALSAIAASRQWGHSPLAKLEITVNLVEALYLLGRWDEAHAFIDDVGSRGTGDPLSRAYVDAHLAQLCTSRGAWDSASNALASARKQADATADPWFVVLTEAIAADMGAWRQDLGSVRGAVRKGRDAVWARSADVPAVETELPAAELLWHGVRAEADAVGTHARVTPEYLAVAAQGAEELVRASRALLARLTAYGPRWQQRLTTQHLMTEQEAERIRGVDDPDGWRTIVEQWHSLKIPYPAAYATYRHADSLFRRRDRATAAPLLVEAHRFAMEAGAGPLRQQVEALAQRSRTELPLRSKAQGSETASAETWSGSERRSQPSLAALSQRESEVVALIANGDTNRQIAERLFVTERTAAAHVSSILGKLGVARRTEAAALWHRAKH